MSDAIHIYMVQGYILYATYFSYAYVAPNSAPWTKFEEEMNSYSKKWLEI